ncbi:hypothetical protein DSM25559_3778 [Agrobacterium rosae]|uniref:Uncharacterized protein n=1 Tax=Agrobacterium rosae TaxID=1972867 RepID=A0A1R3TYU1_9HYPH|nr:hypothetical protein DSM25559_3778 [Agrobacterium rosae]
MTQVLFSVIQEYRVAKFISLSYTHSFKTVLLLTLDADVLLSRGLSDGLIF